MTRTNPFVVSVPTTSTIVPKRGRTAKTVKHRSELWFSVPRLEEHEAPVVATFKHRPSTKEDLGPAYPSWIGWDYHMIRGVEDRQDMLRASPRDLPAVAFGTIDQFERLVTSTFEDPKLFQPFANVADPCLEPLQIECIEAVSSNASVCLSHVANRMDEMFVVGNTVFIEIPGPVVAKHGPRVFNNVGVKASMVYLDGVELLGPGMDREGMTASTIVQPGLTYAMAIAQGMASLAGPFRLDLASLTGDLVRAAGIQQQRLDLYDNVAVREAVDKLYSACHGSKAVTLLKGCLDKGYFDVDVRLDVERFSPGDEMDRSALTVGM